MTRLPPLVITHRSLGAAKMGDDSAPPPPPPPDEGEEGRDKERKHKSRHRDRDGVWPLF